MHRILAVDDEPDILAALAHLLPLLLEVKVDTAPNGREGLQALADHEYDAVISDYRMPGMDGMEFLKQVQQQRPAAHRLLMTAFPDARLAAAARSEAGVEAFLSKPFDVEKMATTLKELLR